MPEPGLATVTANSTIAVLFSKLIVLFVRVCVSSKSTNVASDTAVFNCASVNEPNTAAFPTDVICPVRLAFVVTLAAVVAFVELVALTALVLLFPV